MLGKILISAFNLKTLLWTPRCAEIEKVTAEDIRKILMESLGETKDREKENTSMKQRRKCCLEYKEKHEKRN